MNFRRSWETSFAGEGNLTPTANSRENKEVVIDGTGLAVQSCEAGKRKREELRGVGAKWLGRQAGCEAPKAKKDTWWTIETLNANVFSSGGHFVNSSACKGSLVFLQETRLREDQAKSAEAWARKFGWFCSVNPAIPTKEGSTSGGTAVLTKAALGLGLAPGMRSTTFEKGRVSVAHWSGFAPGGCLVGSIYLRASEGPFQANMLTLQNLAVFLRKAGLPFLFGGDLQMAPE